MAFHHKYPSQNYYLCSFFLNALELLCWSIRFYRYEINQKYHIFHIFYRTMTQDEAQQLLTKRMGMVMSIMLFTRKPRKHKFVQAAVSVEMWRQQASHKLYQTLGGYGVCQGAKAARGHVDRLSRNHDAQLRLWKSVSEVKSTHR